MTNLLCNEDHSTISQNIITQKTPLELVTVNLKKKVPFKSNIQVTKGMTFKDLIMFVFPSGPSSGKRFIARSSFESDGKVYLPEQILSDVFLESHAHVWIGVEKIDVDYESLFDDEE